MGEREYEKILDDWEKHKPKRSISSENWSELMSYFDIRKDRDYEINWRRTSKTKDGQDRLRIKRRNQDN